jgi:hypothetical protein
MRVSVRSSPKWSVCLQHMLRSYNVPSEALTLSALASGTLALDTGVDGLLAEPTPLRLCIPRGRNFWSAAARSKNVRRHGDMRTLEFCLAW